MPLGLSCNSFENTHGCPELRRQCDYIFNNDQKLLKSISKTANFEGLCWLNEKKTQFLVVSDNNFSKNENTVFLLYNIK